MILVSGNGILAKELLKLSTDDLPITLLPRKEMDITDEYVVSDVIKSFMMRPDFPKYFIHTAALTKPTRVSDKNPIMSMTTNIVGTANVAKICYKYDIKFIYISTDFVYSPDKISDENSELKPTNNYGWSKLGGECVSKLVPNSLILRCALCDIPFRHEKAFSSTWRSSIRHKDVAKIILKLKDEIGVVNVGGEYKSVYDFVSQYQEIEKGPDNNKASSLQLSIEKLRGILNE